MALLDQFLAERQAQPFAWGVQDCCTFAADWVLRCKGRDPIEPWRGRVNARAALRTLQSEGGMLGDWTQRWGERIHPMLAQVGDICMVESGYRARLCMHSFGICAGSQIAAPGREGVVFIPITTGIAAWRI